MYTTNIIIEGSRAVRGAQNHGHRILASERIGLEPYDRV